MTSILQPSNLVKVHGGVPVTTSLVIAEGVGQLNLVTAKGMAKLAGVAA